MKELPPTTIKSYEDNHVQKSRFTILAFEDKILFADQFAPKTLHLESKFSSTKSVQE